MRWRSGDVMEFVFVRIAVWLILPIAFVFSLFVRVKQPPGPAGPGGWTRWFSWYPVTLEGQWANRSWLEIVEWQVGEDGKIRYQEPPKPDLAKALERMKSE